MQKVYSANRFGKPLCAVFITGILLAQATYYFQFFPFGRGQYQNTVRYLAAISNNEPLSVGGDHDFRNWVLLDFYKKRTPGADKIEYVFQPAYFEQIPTIFIVHDLSGSPVPLRMAVFVGQTEHAYQLLKSFRSNGVLAGWDWHVYRRTGKEKAG